MVALAVVPVVPVVPVEGAAEATLEGTLGTTSDANAGEMALAACEDSALTWMLEDSIFTFTSGVAASELSLMDTTGRIFTEADLDGLRVARPSCDDSACLCFFDSAS